jgi:hypothetical protein
MGTDCVGSKGRSPEFTCGTASDYFNVILQKNWFASAVGIGRTLGLRTILWFWGQLVRICQLLFSHIGSSYEHLILVTPSRKSVAFG